MGVLEDLGAEWDLELSGSNEWDGGFGAVYLQVLHLLAGYRSPGRWGWGPEFCPLWKAYIVGCPSGWLVTHILVLSV